jgi:hypothetical protein
VERSPVVIGFVGACFSGAGRIQQVLVEMGVGEERDAGAWTLAEIGECAARLLDDGDYCGDVPGARAQKEEGVKLCGGDQESPMTGA